MGMVVTGTSIAMIFGLPMGRFIGLAAGWRMTFACVAFISFVTLAYLFFLLPSFRQCAFRWERCAEAFQK